MKGAPRYMRVWKYIMTIFEIKNKVRSWEFLRIFDLKKLPWCGQGGQILGKNICWKQLRRCECSRFLLPGLLSSWLSLVSCVVVKMMFVDECCGKNLNVLNLTSSVPNPLKPCHLRGTHLECRSWWRRCSLISYWPYFKYDHQVKSNFMKVWSSI